MSANAPAKNPSLSEAYADSPVIRALMQLVPGGIGSAFDVGLQHRASKLKEQRLKTFFEELATGSIELTQEIVESDDFLHCFFIAAAASTRSRRAEKTKLFAKLLKSSISFREEGEIDEIEEFISIIDEMSFREWCALIIFEDYYSRISNTDEANKDITGSYIVQLELKLKIPKNEAGGFLDRLSRTGLYLAVGGVDLKEHGGLGQLTARYVRLKHLLKNS
jgi:hypothetical protein